MITFTELGKWGRCGNMLAEISCVIGLAVRNNDDYVLPSWQYQSDFNIPSSHISSSISPTLSYQEPHFQYVDIPYRDTRGHMLDLKGFWQSWRYWEHCKDIIIGCLSPKNAHPIRWETTSIHIRRGDYIGQYRNAFAHLGMDYYGRAMDMICSPKYLIVSDDIGWCRANFRGSQFEFSDGSSVIEDLKMMVSAEHCIIANSSLSWWGAYLNKNPSKIVISPQSWFGQELAHHNTQDLIPAGWHRI